MIPDTTYQTLHYWRNGKVIHELRPVAGGASQYFLIMQIHTPAGSMQQTPEIEAVSIEEAYTKAEAVEKSTVEAVKAQLGGRIVTAQQIPEIENRLRGPNGPLPGIVMP